MVKQIFLWIFVGKCKNSFQVDCEWHVHDCLKDFESNISHQILRAHTLDLLLILTHIWSCGHLQRRTIFVVDSGQEVCWHDPGPGVKWQEQTCGLVCETCSVWVFVSCLFMLFAIQDWNGEPGVWKFLAKNCNITLCKQVVIIHSHSFS